MKIRKNKLEQTWSEVKRFTVPLDANLLAQLENWLSSQWASGNWTYPSKGSFVRQALQTYREGKIKPDWKALDPKAKKKGISLTWPEELLNFYYSLPKGKRNLIIGEAVRGFLVSQ